MTLAAERDATPTSVDLRAILVVSSSTLASAAYAFMWNSVGVALPHMQGAFAATTDQVAWVMIAFIIGSAMTTASVGWLSTRFGRRPIFLAGIAGFTITLWGCGLSTTLEQEVFWRFLQGIFGAALLPLGQAIAASAFPPERHGQATSLWALGFVTTNVFAPTLAGFLIDSLGWQWIFYANIPISLTALVAAWILLPQNQPSPKSMDWTGFAALIIGVSVLQLMMARGERLDWFDSTEIVIEALIAGLALYIFLAHSFTTKSPFIDIVLLRDRNFTLGLVFIFLVGAVLFLPLLLLPLLLEQIGDYPALETGYLLLPRGIGSVLGLIIMSRLRDKIDPRPVLFFGLLLMATVAWSMSRWTVDINPSVVAWTNFVQGLSIGAVWVPLSTLTLARLKARIQDQGYALFYLCFDIGSSVGTAAIIGLHARHIQINHANLVDAVTPFNELFRRASPAELWDLTEAADLAALQVEITRQATMIAYNNSFLVVAIVLAILIPFIPLFRRHGAPRGESD